MVKKVALVLLCFSFLTGCVGKREINDLALVMAVGIDKAEKDGHIKITAQVARPADARGQTGAPSGQTGDPIWSASAEGETIFEAIRNLATFATRRVFWAHNYAVVINEDVAREKGIADIIDFFTRNPELRMRTWVLVTPNNASEVVSTITGLEVIPGEALDKLFRFTDISAQAPRTQMIDLQSAYLSESSEPVLARVRLTERGVSNKKPGQAGAYKQVELAGAGVFKKDKLVGIIKPDEVRGLLPFVESLESGIVALSCPNNPPKRISVELRKQTFDVTPSYRNQTPSFLVKMHTFASVVEAGCPFSLADGKSIKKLETELEETLKNELTKVVKLAQEDYQSDFLELGKVFNNKYPSEWKEIKDNWEEKFTQAKVEIQVIAELNDSALLYRPTKRGVTGDKE
ncbi:Ger(x)C family spore germination protein [Fredinandcohnia sp. 179-A 10B2 NHS]|uniref:Ger(x)C family spore germination protein n=1 Tax=Fredinandcohnia sp. 179-A 10B2 NHS TaxID=3235176 RepID=UPI0039A16D1C